MEFMYIQLLFVITCVTGCTDFSQKPWVRESRGEPQEGKKIFYSSRVLFATVVELIPDPVFKREGVKAAKLDIACIYKGGELPSRITVVGTGNKNGEIPGCPPAKIKVGESYVFFLNNKTGNYYEIEFQPLGGDPTIILDDLTIYCGLHLEEPIGLTDLSVFDECYEPLIEGCEPYVEPTLSPKTVTTKAPKNNPGEEINPHEEIKPDDEEGYVTNPTEGHDPDADNSYPGEKEMRPDNEAGSDTNAAESKVDGEEEGHDTDADNSYPGGKEIKPDNEAGYDTNPAESKVDGSKVSGSKDNKNSSSRVFASWTFLIVSLILLSL